MRICELFEQSQVINEIINDLMDFLVTYRNRNKSTAPMGGPDGALKYLQDLHHDVTIPGLMNLLSKPPFTDIVERSGPKDIKLKTEIPEKTSPDEKIKDAKKLTKTAEKAAEKTVKSGNLST